MHSYPTLARQEVYSPAFLDAFRDQLHAWSLALYDPASGGFRRNHEIGPNVLSTTDAIWIRYANNDPDLGAPDRDAIVRYIQGKQNPQTGKVPHDPGPAGQGHSDGHAFWQAVRALCVLNAQLVHFPAHLEPVLTPAGLEAWLAEFDWDAGASGHWTGTPWATQAQPSEASQGGDGGLRRGNHHEILGIVPAIASLGDPELTDTLFRGIARQQHPVVGTWPRAGTNISRTFAYTALHLSAGRLPNMPEKILDEALQLQRDNGLWDHPLPGFHTMDATYLLVRLPSRLGGYRQAEATAALRRVGEAMRRIYAAEQATLLDNTHQTLSVVHTFGLLQEAFPDEYPSSRPYRFDWDKLELFACEVIARRAS